jgi:hypothetical protein
VPTPIISANASQPSPVRLRAAGLLAAGSTTSPRHRRGPAHGSDVVPKNSVSMVKLAQTLARPVRTLDRDAHRL